MIIAEHYFRLVHHLSGGSGEFTFKITISEIANILSCSNRNAKYIIKELNEIGWIAWSPLPGRGQTSTLVFSKPSESIFFQLAKEKISKGELTWCFNQLKYFSSETHGKFFTLITHFFGFHKNTHNHIKLDLLRLPYPTNTLELDPTKIISFEEMQIIKQIYDSIVKYNSKTNKIESHIAHHFDFDTTGTNLSLYLRKGVFFHNVSVVIFNDGDFGNASVDDEVYSPPTLAFPF